jgi:hypothetical protein
VPVFHAKRAGARTKSSVAESLENIDVPFEPNDAWTRLAPGVDIRVREAIWTRDFHRYWIEVSLLGQGTMLRPVFIGAPLPSRLVVARHGLGVDGKPLPFGGYPELLSNRLREYGTGRGGERIAAFRFVIAVNPAELEIPFEFTHVPLPDPQP